jgi:hypothetical protein
LLREYGEWTDFKCGMVDFTFGFPTGEITPQPMALFNFEQAVFIHWREEQRLNAAGINPWPFLT